MGRRPEGSGRPCGWVLSIVVFGSVLVFGLVVLYNRPQPFWAELISEHFRAVVGLPLAATAAFAIVLLLQSTHGPIQVEGLGFKFRGAAGPVVTWISAFSL